MRGKQPRPCGITDEHTGSSAAQKAKIKNLGQSQSVRRLIMGWAAEESGFDSRLDSKILLFYTSSKPVMGPTHPSIHVVGTVKLFPMLN
jgi:hypothetical protein